MKKIQFILLLIATIGLWSCGGGDGDGSSSTASSSKGDLKEASGGKYYGGVFKMNETEYFRSLYPLNVTEVTSNRITNQIYEGLVQFDQKDLTIKPCLAERWDITEDGTLYTFHLRKGVKFHDDPCFSDGKGREVTAKDFKYNLDKLCAFDVNNKGYDFYKDHIEGAEAYYKNSIGGNAPAAGCSGIRLVDDYTIQIKLKKPFAGILNKLALPFAYLFPKEAFDTYGVEMRAKTVGTGPFITKAIKENDALILVKNKEYWGKDSNGNQLPYLDGIRWSFLGDQKSELLEFKNGNLDMMYRLPLEMVEDIIDTKGNLKEGYKQYIFQEEPALSVYYYGFKMSEGRFADNKKLRQAFNYAVDRQKIVDYTVRGAGIPANSGIVPPAFAGFDASAVKGYKFDRDKAKQLMAEAGYPNGKGFEELTLQINSGGGRNEQIAEAIQKMIKENLNIDVKITKMPFAQHLEALETSKSEFWRAGWVADYPDPENFINLFNSAHIPAKLTDKSYINSFRFRSPKFDALYNKALETLDVNARMKLYEQADQVMIDEAPIIPIYYYKDRRLVQPNVKNFPQNSMEYRNLRDVYFAPEM